MVVVADNSIKNSPPLFSGCKMMFSEHRLNRLDYSFCLPIRLRSVGSGKLLRNTIDSTVMLKCSLELLAVVRIDTFDLEW